MTVPRQTCIQHTIYFSGCESCKLALREYRAWKNKKKKLPFIPCRPDVNCTVCQE